ncbi:UNVERIFIED_CONTAM: hypothetical protein RMT77_015377 [Armadillidium vulgare]
MVPKGKQGTKGQKQILQENVTTLAFYRNMIIGAGVFYAVISYFTFSATPILDRVLIVLSAIVYFASYRFMASMASPKYGEDGSVLDEGCDLNIEGGIAEHIKDLIILTTACVVLSSISAYFWILWLLAPARAFHLLWVNILAPYIFQPAAEDAQPEMTEKKQRKMERKMMKRR